MKIEVNGETKFFFSSDQVKTILFWRKNDPWLRICQPFLPICAIYGENSHLFHQPNMFFKISPIGDFHSFLFLNVTGSKCFLYKSCSSDWSRPQSVIFLKFWNMQIFRRQIQKNRLFWQCSKLRPNFIFEFPLPRGSQKYIIWLVYDHSSMSYGRFGEAEQVKKCFFHFLTYPASPKRPQLSKERS